MQVVVANRQRTAQLLEAVLPRLPEEQAQAEKVASWGTEICDYVLWMRSLKRQAKKEKRQAEQASAVAAVKEHGSGHKIRQPRAAALHAMHAGGSDDDDTDDTDDDGAGCVPLPLKGDMLIDPWALEGDDPSAALCAVCGSGESEEGNQVVFCERCSVPVHQACYGIECVPEGDWLCWPCRLCDPSNCGTLGLASLPAVMVAGPCLSICPAVCSCLRAPRRFRSCLGVGQPWIVALLS